MARLIVLLALGLLTAGCTAHARTSSPISPAAHHANWDACDIDCRKAEVVRLSQMQGCPNPPAMQAGDERLLMDVSHEDLVRAAQQRCGGQQVAAAPVQTAQVTYRDRDRAVTVGYGHGGRGRPYMPRRYNATAAEAMRLFGPAPGPNHSWRGSKPRFEPVPAGCTERRERVPGGTYVRVTCN